MLRILSESASANNATSSNKQDAETVNILQWQWYTRYAFCAACVESSGFISMMKHCGGGGGGITKQKGFLPIAGIAVIPLAHRKITI
jgi:predicted nucleic acid binding AN1-type Zn finger protein